jgi:hypothetical protein
MTRSPSIDVKTAISSGSRPATVSWWIENVETAATIYATNPKVNGAAASMIDPRSVNFLGKFPPASSPMLNPILLLAEKRRMK